LDVGDAVVVGRDVEPGRERTTAVRSTSSGNLVRTGRASTAFKLTEATVRKFVKTGEA
jgi:hypothetical protein